MKVTLKVFKWDDDLAVELPRELVDRLALKEGDDFEILAASESEDVREDDRRGSPGQDEFQHKGR